MTEQDLVNLKRTIYLTIMSSAGFEEATHKLMKLDLKNGQEMELCLMLVECCSQEKTYLKYYGFIGARFCLAQRVYQVGRPVCRSARLAHTRTPPTTTITTTHQPTPARPLPPPTHTRHPRST